MDALQVTTRSGFRTRPLSWVVAPGESLALVGPGSSGKTLVFEHLAGIRRPGIDASGTSSSSRIGLVPQDPRLAVLPTDKVWTVLRLNAFPIRLERAIGRRPAPSAHERAALELLERVSLEPRRLLGLPFGELSASERKRVLLCASLLSRPKVLAIDGWAEVLDSASCRVVSELLQEEMRRGMSVLLSARAYPLLHLPVTFARELRRPNQVEDPPVPLLQKAANRTTHEYPLLEVDRLVVARRPRRIASRRPAALVVDGASLFVRHGEIMALLGPAGSGKTALLETIAGLGWPHRGVVRVANQDVTFARGRRRARQRRDVQLVFQDAASVLEGWKDVRAHLEDARRLAPKKSAESNEWMDMLGLAPELLDAAADQLSASESQRVDFARSLILSPRLILLDGPECGGINADGGQLSALITSEKRRGTAFLIATSFPETAASLADRIAVLHAGRIVELGSTAQVLTRPAHPVTAQLLAEEGLPPSDPESRPRGCAFVAHCPRRNLPLCEDKEPMLAPLRRPGEPEPTHGAQRVACFVPLGVEATERQRQISAPVPIEALRPSEAKKEDP